MHTDIYIYNYIYILLYHIILSHLKKKKTPSPHPGQAFFPGSRQIWNGDAAQRTPSCGC